MTTSFNPKPFILIIIIIVTVLTIVAILATTTEEQFSSNLNVKKRVINEGDSLKTWTFSNEYGEAFIYINNPTGLSQDSFVVTNRVRNMNGEVVDSFTVALIGLESNVLSTSLNITQATALGMTRYVPTVPAGQHRAWKTLSQFIGDIQVRRLTPSGGSGNADTVGVTFKPMELP